MCTALAVGPGNLLQEWKQAEDSAVGEVWGGRAETSVLGGGETGDMAWYKPAKQNNYFLCTGAYKGCQGEEGRILPSLSCDAPEEMSAQLVRCPSGFKRPLLYTVLYTWST